MKIETLTYSAGDTTFHGYLADPEGSGRRPGVVIVHEAPGLNDHPKRRARMIAELGYVALAVDMYGGGRGAGPGGDDAMKLMGAMGSCFGGLCALELARMGTPLAGVVSFHGILTTKNPEEAKNVTAKILICTGAEDPLVPPEQVA